MADLNLDPSLLEDYALESGATIRSPSGEVFNAAGRKGVYRLPKRVEPEPVPQQADNGQEKLTSALMEMVSKMQPQEQVAPVVNVPPAQVIVNAQPRTAWDFQFTRNADGTIKSIRATPVKE